MAQAENLDSRLMTLEPEQENDAAGELRRQQRGPSASSVQAEEGQTDSQPADWRQNIMAAKKALNFKERVKKKLEEKVLAPVRAATTNRALQWAWKSLIMTWGLTVLWIDAHGLLRMIFGKKLFCQYGEEWLPQQVTDAAGSAGKMVKKSIGLMEGMFVIFLNVILFFALAALLSLFVNESMLKDMGQEAAKNQPPAAQQAK